MKIYSYLNVIRLAIYGCSVCFSSMVYAADTNKNALQISELAQRRNESAEKVREYIHLRTAGSVVVKKNSEKTKFLEHCIEQTSVNELVKFALTYRIPQQNQTKKALADFSADAINFSACISIARKSDIDCSLLSNVNASYMNQCRSKYAEMQFNRALITRTNMTNTCLGFVSALTPFPEERLLSRNVCASITGQSTPATIVAAISASSQSPISKEVKTQVTLGLSALMNGDEYKCPNACTPSRSNRRSSEDICCVNRTQYWGIKKGWSACQDDPDCIAANVGSPNICRQHLNQSSQAYCTEMLNAKIKADPTFAASMGDLSRQDQIIAAGNTANQVMDVFYRELEKFEPKTNPQYIQYRRDFNTWRKQLDSYSSWRGKPGKK